MRDAYLLNKLNTGFFFLHFFFHFWDSDGQKLINEKISKNQLTKMQGMNLDIIRACMRLNILDAMMQCI